MPYLPFYEKVRLLGQKVKYQFGTSLRVTVDLTLGFRVYPTICMYIRLNLGAGLASDASSYTYKRTRTKQEQEIPLVSHPYVVSLMPA
jgi:hypothetical protein